MFDSQDLLDEIRQWVAIETPTRHRAGLDHLLELVAVEFRTLGAKVRTIPGRDGYANHLEIASPWGGDGPGILVLSHLDTVHPVGTIERDLAFRVEGDRAYGPGIYDMKAGAFLGFAAFRSLVLAHEETPLPIRWLITSDEEVGSPTSEPLIRAAGDNAKYVLVTEPARDGGKCVTARKGTARYKIRFHGRPAHSGGRHQDGRSAIKEMARHIIELEGLTDYARGITTNVGLVEGGTAVNTIPEHAALELDVRLPSPEVIDGLLGRIEKRVAEDPDVAISLEGGLDRPPYVRTEATAALVAHARPLAAEVGIDLEETSSGGGSDGNFLADRLPVLDGIGADGGGAHTLEEHIMVSSLAPRAQWMKRLFETLV